jgi:hypothetical protein
VPAPIACCFKTLEPRFQNRGREKSTSCHRQVGSPGRGCLH